MRIRLRLQRRESLADGILMGAREGRVDELARIGMARVDRQAVRRLDSPNEGGEIGEVELGIDALGHQVQGEGHEVDVAGALAVSE